MYIMFQFLGLITVAKEENISVAIHDVSDSNHAIHRQREVKAMSKLSELDGDDLQGFPGGTFSAGCCASRRVVCKLHRTLKRCTQEIKWSE